LALVLACFAEPSLAQTKERAAPPLGTARDGSGPAEGAIKGGSLEPDIRMSPAPRRDVKRCKELGGKLREDCLRDLGATGDKLPGRPELPDTK
jgi:hypothetical protein